MIDQTFMMDLAVSRRGLTRGIVAAADEHGFVVRLQQGDREWFATAQLLATSATPLELRADDPVLCWLDEDEGERAVVLGRIGPPATDALEVAAPATANTDVPDTLVIEARQSLTLRVGDGSITIRDGRILIKGQDLVSHAQRTNRIKGGSVAIN